MNHFEHLTCNYSAALFVIKLRASVKTCYIDDLMALYFIFNTQNYDLIDMRPNVAYKYISEGS